MARPRVKRTFYIEGDVSRLLDQVADAQDANSSRIANRLIKEGLERRIQVLQRVEALRYAAAGTASLAVLAILPFVLA
jgi:predicted transcriptional regulator